MRKHWPRFYKLIGRLPVPCDSMLEHVLWRVANPDSIMQVELTTIKGLTVSTVFLGLDHQHGSGDPLLFETMIFGDYQGHYQKQCSTWEEAEEMHAIAVLAIQSKITESHRS